RPPPRHHRRIPTGDTPMKPAPLTPGQEGKAIRAKLQLSQAQLAVALGVAPDTVSWWENGRRTPPTATIQLLRYWYKAGKPVVLPQPKSLRNQGDPSTDGV